MRKEKPNFSFEKYLEPPACALYVLGAKWTSAIRYDLAFDYFTGFSPRRFVPYTVKYIVPGLFSFLVEKALSSTKLSTKVFNSEITFTGSLKVAVCYFLSSVGGFYICSWRSNAINDW